MKLIAIEEHFLTNEVKDAWKKNADEDDPTHKLHFGEIENRLEEIGNSRLQLMDETGIDVQVLSLTSPSLHNLGSESIALAIQTNDYVCGNCKENTRQVSGICSIANVRPKRSRKRIGTFCKKSWIERCHVMWANPGEKFGP